MNTDERRRWIEVWHEPICGPDPAALCERCGGERDRAIHDRTYAEKRGFEWFTAEDPL